MKNISLPYLLVGSLLLSLGLILLVAISTSESFAGRPDGLYEMILAGVSLLIIVFTFWFTRSSLKKDQGLQLEDRIISGLRFIVSTVMLGYSFTKLHHGHMYLSYASLDSKLNDLSDFETVWSFYGRYSTFQALLGILELIPAILLLFRRTALIGACIMLPVVLNVMMLNVFYNIGKFTLPVSILVAVCDLYIIYSYKEIILDLVQRAAAISVRPALSITHTQKISRVIKFIPVTFFGLLIVLGIIRHHKTNLPAGGFELKELTINGRQINQDSLPDDIYRKIYFEKRRIQSSLVNHNGNQGAAIDFYSTDSIRIMYRNGALDMYVPEDTTAVFKGRYEQKPSGELILKGKQKTKELTAVYEKIPLKEFDYWWE